jgi:hypothetical protein
VIKLICDRYHLGDSPRLWSFLSRRLEASLEVRAPAPAGCGANAETLATGAESAGSDLLDYAAESVAALVGRCGDRETSDGNRVASKGFPTMLARALQAAGWST